MPTHKRPMLQPSAPHHGLSWGGQLRTPNLAQPYFTCTHQGGEAQPECPRFHIRLLSSLWALQHWECPGLLIPSF